MPNYRCSYDCYLIDAPIQFSSVNTSHKSIQTCAETILAGSIYSVTTLLAFPMR